MKRICIVVLMALLALFAVGCNSSSPKDDAKDVVVESESSTPVDSIDSVGEEEVGESRVTCSDTTINGHPFRSYYMFMEANGSSVQYSYLLPVANGNKVIEGIVCDLTEMKPGDNLKDYLENIAAQFMTEEADDEYDMSVESYKTIMPVSVLDKYMSFSYEYGYMDNMMAHFEPDGYVATYKLSNGERLMQDDIISDSFDARLELARKLRSQADEDLGEFEPFRFDNPDAFLVDEMLNNHFYFTADSLIYSYLPYEINFAAGFNLECAVSKEWVKPYLKKDGDLYKYWFK